MRIKLMAKHPQQPCLQEPCVSNLVPCACMQHRDIRQKKTGFTFPARVHSTMYTGPCTQDHVHSFMYAARGERNLTERSSSNKSSDFFSSAKALALEKPTTFKMRHEKYSKDAGREACRKQQRQWTCCGGSDVRTHLKFQTGEMLKV